MALHGCMGCHIVANDHNHIHVAVDQLYKSCGCGLLHIAIHYLELQGLDFQSVNYSSSYHKSSLESQTPKP